MTMLQASAKHISIYYSKALTVMSGASSDDKSNEVWNVCVGVCVYVYECMKDVSSDDSVDIRCLFRSQSLGSQHRVCSSTRKFETNGPNGGGAAYLYGWVWIDRNQSQRTGDQQEARNGTWQYVTVNTGGELPSFANRVSQCC